MSRLTEHPAVRRFWEATADDVPAPLPRTLDADWLRRLCLDAGADDVGFVGVDRADLADQRAELLAAFPHARTAVSFVCRTNRESIRSPARSVANVEFHHATDAVNDVAHRIVARLEDEGVRALNAAAGFPMEMSRWPGGKVWVISHKPIAVAAGLGRMGIHRNVIHPRFGSFVLLDTVLMNARVSAESMPLDYAPCLECKLCVAACPTGAIAPDGRFDFSACYTHNYREFMGGFSDWVEQIADSPNAREYRRRVSDSETVSMWQSLSFGANYKAAYCVAVCPAGDDVIGPFLTERSRFLEDVVRPLQDRRETVYVVPESDAEQHVAKRFPHKQAKRVHGGIRPTSIRGFLRGLPLVFQRGRAAGLDATYHFTFTGEEAVDVTIRIHDGTLEIVDGHAGTADLRVAADSRTWLRFVAREAGILWPLLTRKIRLRGSPRLLRAFGRCFPS